MQGGEKYGIIRSDFAKGYESMSQIIVIGCGFRREQLTLEAVDALQSADKVLLHTGQCGLAEYLQEKGMPYETLDAL